MSLDYTTPESDKLRAQNTALEQLNSAKKSLITMNSVIDRELGNLANVKTTMNLMGSEYEAEADKLISAYNAIKAVFTA